MGGLNGPGNGPNPFMGSFFPGTLQGNRIYMGGNQGAVATALPAFSAGTAYAGGLVLYNPVASGIVVSILLAKCAFILAESSPTVIGLGIGYSATAPTGVGTPIAPENGLVGGGSEIVAGSAKLYSNTSITLPVAPVLARILGSLGSGAETTQFSSQALTDNVDGALVLAPGAFACFVSEAAGAANSFIGSFMWAEQSAGSVS